MKFYLRILFMLVCLFSMQTGYLWPADTKLEKYEELDAEGKAKLVDKKVKKQGDFYYVKVGRYTVFSNYDAATSYIWGCILDGFTDEAIDEKIFPKQRIDTKIGPPIVYILKNRQDYFNTANNLGIRVPEWSGGGFMPSDSKPVLLAFDHYADHMKPEYSVEQKAVIVSKGQESLRKTVMHEATHQMVFYHLSKRAPLWFNEGLATNMEDYDINRRLKANLYNAVYKSDNAMTALSFSKQGKLLSFARLCSISPDEWASSSGEAVAAQYASAWAALNFFLTTKKGRTKFMSKMIKTKASEKTIAKLDKGEVDEAIKEHIETIIRPAVEYGRRIIPLLDAGKSAEAEPLIKEMLGKYPDNLEAQFYGEWLKVLKGEDYKASLKALKDIQKKDKDFYHPNFYYVAALAAFKDGSSLGNSYLRKALKDNRKHAPTLELKKNKGK